MAIPQQINFTGRVEENNGVTMFVIAEKPQETTLSFSFDSLIVAE